MNIKKRISCLLIILILFNINQNYSSNIDNINVDITDPMYNIFNLIEIGKNIAITDSGLDVDKVYFSKTKMKFEDTKLAFDIEFVDKRLRYEYVILVENFQIYHKDIKKIVNLDEEYNKYINRNTISLDIAKQISTAKAGLNINQVVFSKIEYDYNNGRLIYLIEYVKNGIIYSSKVNAYSGVLIDWSANSVYYN